MPGASVPVGKVQPTSDLDRQDTRRSQDQLPEPFLSTLAKASSLTLNSTCTRQNVFLMHSVTGAEDSKMSRRAHNIVECTEDPSHPGQPCPPFARVKFFLGSSYCKYSQGSMWGRSSAGRRKSRLGSCQVAHYPLKEVRWGS